MSFETSSISPHKYLAFCSKIHKTFKYEKERLFFLGARTFSGAALGVVSAINERSGLGGQVGLILINGLNQFILTAAEKINTEGYINAHFTFGNLPDDNRFFMMGGIAVQFGADFTARGLMFGDEKAVATGVILSLIGLTAMTYGEILMDRRAT